MFSCMQVPLLLEAGRREFSRNKDSVRLACFTQGAEANLKNWAIRSSAMGHYEIASSARWHYEKYLVIQIDPLTPWISLAKKYSFNRSHVFP